MTPRERASLAEQISGNPLFTEIIDRLEQSAIERLVSAATEQDRIEAQWRVNAARSFRRDLANALSTRERKGAPA